jgi:hypothetical protein
MATDAETSNNVIFWNLLNYIYDNDRCDVYNKQCTPELNRTLHRKHFCQKYPMLKHLDEKYLDGLFDPDSTDVWSLELVKHANKSQKIYVEWLKTTKDPIDHLDKKSVTAIHQKMLQNGQNLHTFYESNKRLANSLR